MFLCFLLLLFFLVLVLFLFVCFVFFFVVGCCCFCFCFLWFFVFFVLFFCFLGGFKGQVRWPKGPPHLALNPPFIFFAFLLGFCFFCFPFFVLNRKTLFLTLKKAIFVNFSVFPFVSL